MNASDATVVAVRSDVASITECADFDPLLATLDHQEERTITVPFDNSTSLEVDDLAIGIWSQPGSAFEAFNNTEPLPLRTESQLLEPEPDLTEFVCWGSDDETNRVARAHWATLNANHTFGEYFDWHGLDGDGVTPLTVTVLEIPEDMPAADWPISSGQYKDNSIVVASPALFPGNIAHEYTHGVLEHARAGAEFPLLEEVGETGAIAEAFADIMGVLATHRADPEGNVDPWCISRTGDYCDRNISNPEASNDSFEEGNPVQRPDTYLGPNWRPVGGKCGFGNDHCEIHHNSTVASHWVYTLTQGRSGDMVNDLGCSAEVLPLATSFDLSLFYASNALFASVGLIEPNAGLLDLRGMTSLVAQDLFGSTAMRVTMERAWHAVGVGPGPTPEAFSPLDGATDIEPWATELRFSVAPEDSGPWVLRYADNPDFEDATVVDVTDTVVSDGITYAQVYATLDAGVEYFWQAREGTGGSAETWTACSPFTASFKTSEKPIRLTIPNHQVKGGYYLTNNMGQVAWEPVRNAGSYQALLREGSDGCERPDSDWTDIPLNLWRTLNPEVFLGQTIDQNLVLDRDPVYLWPSTDLAPDTTYHLFVRAMSNSGGRGTCSHFEVRKIQLEPFQKLSPLDFATVPYRSGGPLVWTPSEGADRYEVLVENFTLEEGWKEVLREVLDADGLEVNDDNQIALTLGDASATSIPGQMTWHVTAVDRYGDRRGGWDPGVPDYRTDANFWNGPEQILETATEDGANAPSVAGETVTVVNLVFPEGEERETQTCFDPGGNTAGVLWALYPEGTTEVNLEDFQDLPLDPDSDEDFPVCTPRYELVDDATFLVAFPYSNVVHDAPTALGEPTVLLLEVRACGGEGHECCSDETCVEGLVCDEGICADVACGELFQPCCADHQCPGLDHTRWVCLDGECLTCGGVGEECCSDGDPCTDTEISACHEGRCKCGVEGTPSCDSGNPSAGGCATPNTTNQDGSCEPVLPCGTPVPYAGANTPESYEIEMGASQGSAILALNTYEAADWIRVYYEGELVVESGCVSTGYLADDCVVSEEGVVLSCCEDGACAMAFAYGPGSSTSVTVEVAPNCMGTPNTLWTFTVECPD